MPAEIDYQAECDRLQKDNEQLRKDKEELQKTLDRFVAFHNDAMQKVQDAHTAGAMFAIQKRIPPEPKR